MNIPQIPTGRNSYYDLGPTKQFDVETIREALRLYEDDLTEKFETAKPNSMERIEMGAKKVSAQTLIARLSRRLPLYADWKDSNTDMTNTEIIATMSRCVCGTRIQWTQNLDNSTHRGVVDEFYPQNGAEDAYLAVIEPGRYIPVLGASEIQKISILEDSHHDA